MGNSLSLSKTKKIARKQLLVREFREYWVDMPDLDARIKKFLGELSDKDTRLLTTCPRDLMGRVFIINDVSEIHPDISLYLEVFKLIDWYVFMRVVAVVGPTDVMNAHFAHLFCDRTVEDIDGPNTVRKVVGDYSVKWYKNNSTTYIESKGNQEPVLRYMYKWRGGYPPEDEVAEQPPPTPSQENEQIVAEQPPPTPSLENEQPQEGEPQPESPPSQPPVVVEKPLNEPDRLVFAGVLTPYGTEPFAFNEHTYVRLSNRFAEVWKKVVTKPVKPGEERVLHLWKN